MIAEAPHRRFNPLTGEVKPRESEFEQEDVGAVDMTPWRFAKPVGLLLILIVLAIYITFADFSVLTTNGE